MQRGRSDHIITQTFGNLSSDLFWAARANEWMFSVNSFWYNSLEAFIKPETQFFINHIPLSNEQGALLINPVLMTDDHSVGANTVLASLGIVSGQNTALAWEFTRYLMHEYAMLNVALTTPIQRSYFPDVTLYQTMHALDTRNVRDRLNHPSVDERAQIAQNAVNRIAVYNEMPMALLNNQIPFSLYVYNMGLFFDGIIPAEEFAQRTHNAVSLWLIE